MTLHPLRILRATVLFFFVQKERFFKVLITSHARPLFAKDVRIIPDIRSETQSVAILIQGPLCNEHDFTLETVRLYKKAFPKVVIILSTWEEEKNDHMRKIRNEDIHIIENKKPSEPGIANINFQIHSTTEGIKAARLLGATFILKTRTDQRMYNARVLEYFDAAMRTFPLKSQSPQKERLFIVGMNTFMYRPYSVSDMIMYGTVDDMERYWCVPLSIEKNTLPRVHSMLEWSQARHAEVYFVTHFLESLGHTPLFTLADSWAAYRDRFCVVDKESIDIFWYKYDKGKEYRRLRYGGVFNDQELTFRDWLILYQNPALVAPEEVIHQRFGGVLNS
jgi:hypothetical protein